MALRTHRNPAWMVPAAVAGTAIVVGSAAFLGVRHLVMRRLSPTKPPRLEPDPVPTVWWEHDLAEVMPTKADFPLGWDVDDIGFFDPAGVDGYRFAWRLLKLRAPSERCSPPCEWIVVATGEGHGREVAGFWGAQTRQEALELLQTKHEVVS